MLFLRSTPRLAAILTALALGFARAQSSFRALTGSSSGELLTLDYCRTDADCASPRYCVAPNPATATSVTPCDDLSITCVCLPPFSAEIPPCADSSSCIAGERCGRVATPPVTICLSCNTEVPYIPIDDGASCMIHSTEVDEPTVTPTAATMTVTPEDGNESPVDVTYSLPPMLSYEPEVEDPSQTVTVDEPFMSESDGSLSPTSAYVDESPTPMPSVLFVPGDEVSSDATGSGSTTTVPTVSIRGSPISATRTPTPERNPPTQFTPTYTMVSQTPTPTQMAMEPTVTAATTMVVIPPAYPTRSMMTPMDEPMMTPFTSDVSVSPDSNVPMMTPFMSEIPMVTPMMTDMAMMTPAATGVAIMTPATTDMPLSTPMVADVPKETSTMSEMPMATDDMMDMPIVSPMAMDTPLMVPMMTEAPSMTPIVTDMAFPSTLPSDMPTVTPVMADDLSSPSLMTSEMPEWTLEASASTDEMFPASSGEDTGAGVGSVIGDEEGDENAGMTLEPEEGVCIDARALSHLPPSELVYSTHRRAAVLCDATGSCATPGHAVVHHGSPMLMASYCAKPDVQCSSRIMQVNSPRFRQALRISSRTPNLTFTALAARYGTSLEEVILVRIINAGW